jgi:hypothetical protein
MIALQPVHNEAIICVPSIGGLDGLVYYAEFRNSRGLQKV